MLRADPAGFDSDEARRLAREMGRLEIMIAIAEAEAYRDVRVAMSDAQLAAAMDMRGEFVIDESQVASLDVAERGAALSVLCSGCHGTPGAPRNAMVGPRLDGFWDRPIASERSFEYSDALRAMSEQNGTQWTPDLLDAFLADPKGLCTWHKDGVPGVAESGRPGRDHPAPQDLLSELFWPQAVIRLVIHSTTNIFPPQERVL